MCVLWLIYYTIFETFIIIICLPNIDLFYKFRLDQILGRQGSKAKDVYESKLSLASRIVKTERQVIFAHTLHMSILVFKKFS